MAGVTSLAAAALAWAALPPQPVRTRADARVMRAASRGVRVAGMAGLVIMVRCNPGKQNTVIAEYNTSFQTCKAAPPCVYRGVLRYIDVSGECLVVAARPHQF